MNAKPRLQQSYDEQIRPALEKELGRRNTLSLPKLDKVVISMGIGLALQERKRIDAAVADLALLSGQRPVVCKAKKSVSNFKLRKGYAVGCKVTLRGERMFEFLDRLIRMVIPRIRDFRGLSPQAFDGHGNYSMGLTDQSVFPEIDIDKIEYSQGMNVTIVTTAGNDSEGRQLLTHLGMPFRN